MKGKRKRGRQKKRWEDNINEWTGMDFVSSTRAAENRSRWKGIVAHSSVVPRRPSKVMGYNRKNRIELIVEKGIKGIPLGIWCQNDIVSTSMRCHHVEST